MATKTTTPEEKKEDVALPEVSAPEDKTVEVKESQLAAVLEMVEKQSKEIETLKSTVSSVRYKEAEERLGKDNRSRVHFKVLRGNVVVGWPDKGSPDKRNELLVNPTNNLPVGEILKSKYYFVDGTESDMIDQVEFVRSSDLEYARITQDHGETVEVEFENKGIVPNTITVNKKFLNA